MRGACAFLATGVASVLPAFADDARDAALMTVLAEHGCRMAERDAGAILGPHGFDPEYVSGTVAVLIADGFVSEAADGTVHFPVEVCPPDAPAPSPRQAVLATMRDAGCSLDEPALREAHSDLSDAQLSAIFAPLVDSGAVTIDRGTATLSPALCEGGPT